MELATEYQLLSDWRKDIDIRPSIYIKIAIQLANVLSQEHMQYGAIGNLNTSQITISPDETNIVWYFHSSEKKLAYMAPEQFGIIQRRPDIRSDLYSLGVIFYELLFNHLPYETESEQHWPHVHLYASPKQTIQESDNKYAMIYRVIEKLLQKSPEDRYQSAYGVLYDLNHISNVLLLSNNAILGAYVLGEGDRKQSLHLYDYVLSRNICFSDLEVVRKSLSESPRVHLQLLTGEPGIGKTTILEQYSRLLDQHAATVISITCQPSAQGPFAFLQQLQQELLRHLIVKDMQTLHACRAQLEVALGDTLPAWLQMFPVASWLWKQTLHPVESFPKEVLQQALRKSLQVVFGLLKPDVLLLDDSDEIDDESLHIMLEWLQTDPYSIMVIACSSLSHPRCIENRLKQRTNRLYIKRIELEPLQLGDIRQWLSHAIREQSTRISRISHIIYHWTGGNPKQIIAMLESWMSKQALYYDRKKHRWSWELHRISNDPGDTDSISLLRASLKKLQTETKRLLSYASVFGMQFSAERLATILESDVRHIQQQLADAIELGLLALYDDSIVEHPGEERSHYLFLNRLHQKHLYQSLSRKVRATLHLKIGNMVLNDNIELARYHWNKAVPVMKDSIKQRLVQLNYAKAIHAYQLHNYQEAAHQFKQILYILLDEVSPDPDSLISYFHRKKQEPDTFVLHIFVHLSIALSYGQDEQGKRYFELVEQYQHHMDSLDHLKMYLIQIEQSSFIDNEKAVELSIAGLQRFGYQVNVSSQPSIAILEVLRTIREVRVYAKHLFRTHVCEEKAYVAQCQLMGGLLFPYLIHDVNGLLIQLSRFIRYGLKQGMHQSFLHILSAYEVLIQRCFPALYRTWPKSLISQLTLYIKHTAEQTVPPNTLYANTLLRQLEQPLEAEKELLHINRVANETSNTLMQNITAMTAIVVSQGHPVQLAEILQRIESDNMQPYMASIQFYKTYIRDYYEAWHSREKLYAFIQLNEQQEADPIDNYIAIQRAEQAYLAGEFEVGMKWIRIARENELRIDWIRNRRMRVFEALLAAQLYFIAPSPEKARYRKLVLRRLKRIKNWSGAFGCGSSAHLLLRAEATRIEGDNIHAIPIYEQAAEQARIETYTLLEGIAYEQLAYTCRDIGCSTDFYLAIVDAIAAYHTWGAKVKAQMLTDRYLEHNDTSLTATSLLEKSADVTCQSEAVLRLNDKFTAASSRWTCSENDTDVEMSSAQEDFLRTITLKTGAERSLLVRLCRDDVEVLDSYSVDNNFSRISSNHGSTQPFNHLALTLLRYVHRTNEHILLDHAAESKYRNDPYIQLNQVKSILCMPLTLPGENAPFILYVESRSISRIFSSKTIETIELLSTKLRYLQLMQPAIIAEFEPQQLSN